MKFRLPFTSVVLFAVAFGCAGAKPDDRFEVSLRAASDDSAPLSDVAFATGNVKLGTTNSSGAFKVRLKGAEGQTLPLAITCPAGYQSAGEPPPLRLTRTRRVGDTVAQPLAIDVTCTRKLRDVVLVVRSENAANLPVHVDGKAATSTSGDGTAHLLLQLDRDVRKVSVTLDTTEQPRLRPQNPSRTFELQGKDAVLVLDQPFSVVSKPAARSGAAPKRHIPYKIQ
jgi:hypothetical protein